MKFSNDMHFGRFKTAEEGIEYCKNNLKRVPEQHAECTICRRASWMEDEDKKGWTLTWGEYVSGRGGEGAIKLKGKIDNACLSTIRRNCPQTKRPELRSKYENDDEWRKWFEGKRGTSSKAADRRRIEFSTPLPKGPLTIGIAGVAFRQGHTRPTSRVGWCSPTLIERMQQAKALWFRRKNLRCSQ